MHYSSAMRFLLGIILLSCAASCVSPSELRTFRPLDPVTLSPQDIKNRSEMTAQPDDLLRITVSSLDPQAAEPFNMPEEDQNQNRNTGGGGGVLSLELTTGYFVDRDGYIDFPVLGPIYVNGLTLTEIKEKLVELLSEDYLRNPVINIRFLNFKISILGEVNSPGLVRLSNKRVTILEALALAGDYTPYADRSQVLVMREEGGVRTFTRLDFKNEDIFNSPYYYLQQNDVIYVEPIDARVATVADPANRIIQYASAALSLLSVIIALAIR